eukprot:c28919_g1_i1 orf=288-1634(+)
MQRELNRIVAVQRKEGTGVEFADLIDDVTGNNHLMIVSDLDFTMVDRDDHSHAAQLNFNCLWAAEYAHNSVLVYSTGRSLERYLQLRAEAPLLTPAVLILSVGTEIRFGPSLECDTGWKRALDDGWNRDIVVEEAVKIPNLYFQEEIDQGPHKVSFKLEKKDATDIQRLLLRKLHERGLKVKLIYSGGVDLDVLPYKAGKGESLSYLLQKVKREGSAPNNVLVCGDSGNDTELFTVEGVKGVIVSNAHEELTQWYESHKSSDNVLLAKKRCAGGIIEALEHFNLGPCLSPREQIESRFIPLPATSGNYSFAPHVSARKEVVEFNVFFEKWLKGEVQNNDDTYQRLTGVVEKDATMVSHSGKESSFIESLLAARSRHGAMQEKGFVMWVDNIMEHKLAEGVYLVTWQLWEQLAGEERKGYFATAIFVAKEGTPNGVVWLHFHETARAND